VAEAFVRPDTPMCVVLLTYTTDLEAVDAHLKAHGAWLRQGFEAGVIVVAGRRTPRTGGVILFRGEKEAVEKVAASDPFVAEGVATAEVIPFTATLAATALADLLG
jgi:uncharacterized protein YciI